MKDTFQAHSEGFSQNLSSYTKETVCSPDGFCSCGGRVPRLAMINDIAGFGRCSSAVSLPVISKLKVQVCLLPTMILSNHFGFPVSAYYDYTPHMQEHLRAWEQLQLSFDGLYCGFLGSAAQMNLVKEFLQSPVLQKGYVRPHPVFLLDPVLGDHGKPYATITGELISGMKELAAHAHILTPNITEACLLTDTPYHEGEWSTEELTRLCRCIGPESDRQRIVITGLQKGQELINFIWENGQSSSLSFPSAGASRPGTGDIFASILAADAVRGLPFADSVRKAAIFIAKCICSSEKAGTPVQEGVLFENVLDELC